MGLSGERTSPQSMNTCFESEPQMPVRRGFVTTQSGSSGRGSSMSTRRIGVCREGAQEVVLGVGAGGFRSGFGLHPVQQRAHDDPQVTGDKD